MKDTKTVLLAMLSVGLVGTWVYYIYDKSVRNNHKAEVITVDPAAAVQSIQDSLQKVYSFTVDKLGAQLDSVKNTAGQLQGELNARLQEINNLKTEIAALLKKTGARKEDIELAGRKTTQLQQLVAGLGMETKDMADDKKQVAPIPTDQNNTPAKKLQPDNQVARQENNSSSEKISRSSLFTVSELKFTPIALKDDKEVETNQAESANKLIISFVVQNNATSYANAEVFAIITQPDGKVMQTDAWDASSIPTHDYGKKPYTRKMKFEYQKGETKQLQATIRPEDYERGNYTLQVFHNGYLVGQSVKILN
jgi:uncharacterized protein YoxC